MARDPEIQSHQEWLGYVQPVGLVVSIPALTAAQAYINRNIAPTHSRFLECLVEIEKDGHSQWEYRELGELTQAIFDWQASDLVRPSSEAAWTSLEVALPEYNETLRPTYAVGHDKPADPAKPWMLLIQELASGVELDEPDESDRHGWHAAPQAKFERLLRETEIPIGLLANRRQIRLVYAPRGESSGYATFQIHEMRPVAGRSILAALVMLLHAERLFTLPDKHRLPAILADSRKYQNVVSTQLAEQVLAALFELLRGFQAANDSAHGQLLKDVLDANPDEVYAGLLAVLMRLVFLLYAEDRNLVSTDPVYSNHYSVTGLFDRLRIDAGQHPDTMNQRYGAYAQLLALFRLVYEGGAHGGLKLPARKGHLFDPERYPFLEGRNGEIGDRESGNPEPHPPAANSHLPRIPDGVIFHVLSNLLILDGERLSYRTLDVEQIGSVYEAVMGFSLQTAEGRSIAIKSTKSHGAPATINLEALLEEKPAARAKWLTERTDQKLTGAAAEGLKAAKSVEDLLAALEKKIAKDLTPAPVPKGAMVLQPSDERRRSGSHYTPRSLTEPIVRTTLKPVLDQLGEKPAPEQILNLKICDPAMGSGAFLVEACRQLADELVKAWHTHGKLPTIPPDEDEVLHARRLVAQRCLYGVDKNPMAVDLAKLSLWLATLAKDHPFTFLDHSLKAGDSLVGLSWRQIINLDWKETEAPGLFLEPLSERLRAAAGCRSRILAARDEVPYEQLQSTLADADGAMELLRLAGDAVIAAFFAGDSDKHRRKTLTENQQSLMEWVLHANWQEREILAARIGQLKSGPKPVVPFHWEIEFPEVFLNDHRA